MTQSDFNRKYNAIFAYHFLFTGEDGKTYLAGTQAQPTPERPVFAYSAELDDFTKLHHEKVVAVIRIKTQKSAI